MSHKHLNYLKRCQILALWKAGFNQNQIAKEIGVHKSTISREFSRNLVFVRTHTDHLHCTTIPRICTRLGVSSLANNVAPCT